VDREGHVQFMFDDVSLPRHLSIVSEDHVLVADFRRDRLLLLNSELQLQQVLISRNSRVKLSEPKRLNYDELTSQLYVVHGSKESPDVISIFSLR